MPRLPEGSPAQRLAGHPEEYASRADVIASLWSDIIAENPELYGPPDGLASLEAETIFLPCTSELPGQPGAVEKMAAWAAELGLEAGDLDDLVHAAYSKLASEVNSSGLSSQIRFLIESYGTGGALSLLSGLRPEAAGRATAAGTAEPAAGAEQRTTPAPGR